MNTKNSKLFFKICHTCRNDKRQRPHGFFTIDNNKTSCDEGQTVFYSIRAARSHASSLAALLLTKNDYGFPFTGHEYLELVNIIINSKTLPLELTEAEIAITITL